MKAENDKAIKCANSFKCAIGFVKRAGGVPLDGYNIHGLRSNRGYFLSPKGLLWRWSTWNNYPYGEEKEVRFSRVAGLGGVEIKTIQVENRAELEREMTAIDTRAVG